MKFVTFVGADSKGHPGVLDSGSIVDLQAADAAFLTTTATGTTTHAPHDFLTDLTAILSGGARSMDYVTQLVEFATEEGNKAILLQAQSVKLMAPIPRPRRIRDYMTYAGHAAGSGLQLSAAFSRMPSCYKCNVESVVGPGEDLLWPPYSDQLDFEMEIAFVTSGGGRNLSVAEAGSRIAGVTIFNDVSARDIQLFEMEVGIGPSKGKDFCSALGPCIVTMDEVDEFAIECTVRVNGDVWAVGDTKDRQFSFAEILAWASYGEDVYPGEVLAIGTMTGGCGLELDRWVVPGDVIELDASGIGVLRNRVASKEAAPAGAGIPTFQGAPRHIVKH